MNFKPMTQSMLVMLPLLLHALGAEACRAPPRHQLVDVAEQIRTAKEVAVGQVISAIPIGGQDVQYTLITLESLAGHPGMVFTVTGDARGNDTTFNDHSDFTFWARGGGRVSNDSNCDIRPDFVVGSSYLVFLGTSFTHRSVEKIEMVNGAVKAEDRWLAYVKQQLAQRQFSDAAVTPAASFAARDYERIGRFIYRFHRIVARDDLEWKTLAARNAPDALRRRAHGLAAEFDHIVNSNAVPDAEIDATLAEAAAVKELLTAWSGNADGTASSAP